eukprot:m.70215 g.70215  ORF g.70215 m.70215 type:complete len:351 (+) comp50117_c1_seq1:1768-2820(+)
MDCCFETSTGMNECFDDFRVPSLRGEGQSSFLACVHNVQLGTFLDQEVKTDQSVVLCREAEGRFFERSGKVDVSVLVKSGAKGNLVTRPRIAKKGMISGQSLDQQLFHFLKGQLGTRHRRIDLCGEEGCFGVVKALVGLGQRWLCFFEHVFGLLLFLRWICPGCRAASRPKHSTLAFHVICALHAHDIHKKDATDTAWPCICGFGAGARERGGAAGNRTDKFNWGKSGRRCVLLHVVEEVGKVVWMECGDVGSGRRDGRGCLCAWWVRSDCWRPFSAWRCVPAADSCAKQKRTTCVRHTTHAQTHRQPLTPTPTLQGVGIRAFAGCQAWVCPVLRAVASALVGCLGASSR